MEPYDNVPMPVDWQDKAEWIQARLMYPNSPDRPLAAIHHKDAIFHTVYALDDRYQILGTWALRGGGGAGGMYQRAAGTQGHWMGIYDDHNRIMVALTYNNDVGDSWELADDPRYPERFSALGIRQIGRASCRDRV